MDYKKIAANLAFANAAIAKARAKEIAEAEALSFWRATFVANPLITVETAMKEAPEENASIIREAFASARTESYKRSLISSISKEIALTIKGEKTFNSKAISQLKEELKKLSSEEAWGQFNILMRRRKELFSK